MLGDCEHSDSFPEQKPSVVQPAVAAEGRQKQALSLIQADGSSQPSLFATVTALVHPPSSPLRRTSPVETSTTQPGALGTAKRRTLLPPIIHGTQRPLCACLESCSNWEGRSRLSICLVDISCCPHLLLHAHHGGSHPTCRQRSAPR